MIHEATRNVTKERHEGREVRAALFRAVSCGFMDKISSAPYHEPALMRDARRPPLRPRASKRLGLPLAVLLLLFASASCRSGGAGVENESGGIVVVNAPAAGVVRRVLVSEGVSVNEGAGVVEIAVGTQPQGAPVSPTEDPVARAAKNIGAAQSETEAARAEVVRAEVEVRRLEPLVAAGQASQGELDGARATYERAQQRLQRAQASAQSAQSGLVAARQQQMNGTTAPAARAEQTVVARATSAGRVAVVNVREGDVVTMGQPLATLRAGSQ
jgi:biotin carboxyl carrier protein